MEVHQYISWNIRGANSVESRFQIKQMIEANRPAIFCLQETKCMQWKDFELYSLGFGRNVGWKHSPSRGQSGGLLTIWNTDSIEVTSHSISRHWLMIKGINKVNQEAFACINVYAPQESIQKVHLWEELGITISTLQECSVCLLGDFNAVRSAEEKFLCGCIYFRHRVEI